MTLRLSEEETLALRQAAEAEHRSMQEVARTAIAEYVKRRLVLRDQLLDQIFTEDADLLRRLAE